LKKKRINKIMKGGVEEGEGGLTGLFGTIGTGLGNIVTKVANAPGNIVEQATGVKTGNLFGNDKSGTVSPSQPNTGPAIAVTQSEPAQSTSNGFMSTLSGLGSGITSIVTPTSSPNVSTTEQGSPPSINAMSTTTVSATGAPESAVLPTVSATGAPESAVLPTVSATGAPESAVDRTTGTVSPVAPVVLSTVTGATIAAEHIGIHLYSYNDEIEGPVVKINIEKDKQNVDGTVKGYRSVNKTNINTILGEIVNEKVGIKSEFNNNFNINPASGKKSIISSYVGSETTVENAIVELLEKKRNDPVPNPNVITLDTLLTHLQKVPNKTLSLRVVPDVIINGQPQNVKTLYDQLVGKQASTVYITQKVTEITNEIGTLIPLINKENASGARQIKDITEIKNGVDLIASAISDKGKFNERAYNKYLSNIKLLKNKLNKDTGLFTEKTMMGYFEKDPMNIVKLRKALEPPTGFFSGGKTRKQKKTKRRNSKKRN